MQSLAICMQQIITLAVVIRNPIKPLIIANANKLFTHSGACLLGLFSAQLVGICSNQIKVHICFFYMFQFCQFTAIVEHLYPFTYYYCRFVSLRSHQPPSNQSTGFHWFHWNDLEDKVTIPLFPFRVVHLDKWNMRFSHIRLYFCESEAYGGGIQCLHGDWPLIILGIEAMR